MMRRVLRASVAALVSAAWGVPPAAAGALLWQTNSEGDDLHVFHLESRQLVRRLAVGPEPHGIAAPADGSVIYVTLPDRSGTSSSIP